MKLYLDDIERRFVIFVIGLGTGICVQFLALVLPRMLPRWMIFRVPSFITRVAATDMKDNIREKLTRYPAPPALTEPPAVQTVAGVPDNVSYAVADLDTGKLVGGQSTDLRRPIASLTKVMTAIVAHDLLAQDALLTVSAGAAAQIPTKLGLAEGEQVTVDSLLAASLLTSANDAAQVLADGVEERYRTVSFVEAMNLKAAHLNLRDTRFANPQGFDDPDNYSTPRDLLQLTAYFWQHYPELRTMVKEEKRTLNRTLTHKRYTLMNWNGLVGVYPGCLGLKIGNTDAAGKTTLAVATRGGHTLAVVVLDAGSEFERDLVASRILDAAFAAQYGLVPAQLTIEQLQTKYRTWFAKS